MERGRNGYWFISKASCFSLHKHLLHLYTTKAFFGIRYHRHQIGRQISLRRKYTHMEKSRLFPRCPKSSSSLCPQCSSRHLSSNGFGSLSVSCSWSLSFCLPQYLLRVCVTMETKWTIKINKPITLRESKQEMKHFTLCEINCKDPSNKEVNQDPMGGNKVYIGLSTDMSSCVPGTNPKLHD